MRLAAWLNEEILVLFAILAFGSWLGQLSFKGLTLGSAGVLFVALFFGHFGLKVPRDIMDLGLVLFVYAVGLQAGPRFFRTFRRSGIQYVVIGVVTVSVGALVAAGLAALMHIPADLACGLYTGAMTCTPALAAAMDAAGRSTPVQDANLSVGYGIAYPFSMLGVVLLIQLLPKLLRRDLAQEEETWLKEQQADRPRLQVKQFRVTNPNCDGVPVTDVNPGRMSLANITRVRRGDDVFMATPELKVRLGDVLMVTGPADELDKMRFILGEETQVPMDMNRDILSVEVDVTETDLAGKEIGQLRVWQRYGVVVTRIRRQGFEIAPTGSAVLDMGDTLVVVGERSAVAGFVKVVDPGKGKADETNMVPFLVGLVLGIGLGAIPVDLPGGMTLKLGSAGGAFLVSLLLGHFGKIGRLRLYVPQAAKNLSRELGLMLFLAGAGTTAGARFVGVLQQQGWTLFLAGALITTASVEVGLFLMDRVYRMGTLSSMGALCACMTNPPGLGSAAAQTRTDLPTLAYASVYPVALIFKIVIAQLLVELLGRAL